MINSAGARPIAPSARGGEGWREGLSATFLAVARRREDRGEGNTVKDFVREFGLAGEMK
jgi:hypothetical protein